MKFTPHSLIVLVLHGESLTPNSLTPSRRLQPEGVGVMIPPHPTYFPQKPRDLVNGAAYEVPQDRIGARRAQYTASGPPHQRVAILRLASNVFCAETDIGELVRQMTSAQISELRAQLPHPETRRRP